MLNRPVRLNVPACFVFLRLCKFEFFLTFNRNVLIVLTCLLCIVALFLSPQLVPAFYYVVFLIFVARHRIYYPRGDCRDVISTLSAIIEPLMQLTCIIDWLHCVLSANQQHRH